MMLLASSTLALVARLANLQIMQHDQYAAQARSEHWSRDKVPAHRGAIRDRNGYALAITATTYDLYLKPKVSGPVTAANTAKALAPLIDVPPEKIMATLTGEDKGKALVAANISYATGEKIRSMGLPGVEAVEKVRRFYPEGNLGSTLMGFVGKDGNGLTGAEESLDGDLAGIAGLLVYERDSTGEPIPLGINSLTPPEAGADVYLTIDRYIQRLAERELDKAMEKHKASGGTIIVMDPKTGELLAMASRPAFDLTKIETDLAQLNPKDSKQVALFRNRAVADVYEPGSTFKIITMASAVNEGLVNANTTYYDGGPVNKYGWNIDTWNGKHFGQETMTQLLQHSNNVGAVWVSDRLGTDRFYKYVRLFGFGQATNVGLAGEGRGQVRYPTEAGWYPVDLAVNSFGQGISVTPLQMITAASAVANGGSLMQPYVVKRIEGPRGTRSFSPVPVRRVVSEATSRTLREMLTKVAEGENTVLPLAAVPGYKVAGKTGTASIPGPGGYTSAATIASFIGFGPSDNPRFIILVKIDEPQDSPWGSLVASPIFSSIAKQTFAYLQIPPTDTALALANR